MALQLTTDVTFQGINDIPARAPLPNDALGIADFMTGLQYTQTLAQVGPTANAVILPSSTPAGFYYGQNGLAYSPNDQLGRIGYGQDGYALGLLLGPTFDQRIPVDQRQNLSAGSAVGAAVATSGTGANGWDQWYSVTPSGTGEASLTLGGGALGSGGYAYISFDVRGTGIVQVGARGMDADDYVNFDLASGVTQAGAGAVGAMIRRPGGGWTCGIRIRASAAVTEVGPYVASVASLATTKLGAAGATFTVRAPSYAAESSSSGRPLPTYYGLTTSSTKNGDNIAHSTTMLPTTADFSVVIRYLSGWWPHQLSAGMAYFAVSASKYVEVGFDATNTLVIRSNTTGPIYTFNIKWTPNTIYRVGMVRSGSTLIVTVNGETAVVSSVGEVDGATVRLGKGSDAAGESWGGYLQKMIFWNGAKSAPEIANLSDRWL